MVQFDLFGNPEASSQEEFKIQNGEYIYIPKFFPKIEADNFLNVFEGFQFLQNHEEVTSQLFLQLFQKYLLLGVERAYYFLAFSI